MSGLRYRSLDEMPPDMRKRLGVSHEEVGTMRTIPKGRRGPRRDEEHEQQVVFFNRIRTLALNDKRYAMAVRRTFAIPNGGGRSKREAGRLKAEGVKKGVSDIECSLPRWAGQCGLYIEMKSSTGRVSDEQQEWISESIQLGYRAVVCRSADEAFEEWKAYVEQKPWQR